MWILTGEKVSKVQNSVLADSVLHGLSPSNARGGAGGGSILSGEGNGELMLCSVFLIFNKKERTTMGVFVFVLSCA